MAFGVQNLGSEGGSGVQNLRSGSQIWGFGPKSGVLAKIWGFGRFLADFWIFDDFWQISGFLTIFGVQPWSGPGSGLELVWSWILGYGQDLGSGFWGFGRSGAHMAGG